MVRGPSGPSIPDLDFDHQKLRNHTCNSYLDLILQTAYSAKVSISGPSQFNKTVGQSTNIRCTLKFEEDEEFSEKPDLLWTDPKGNTGN